MPSSNPFQNFAHSINLVLGDWSADGHSLTETVTIACNLDGDQLWQAYEQGVAKLGLNVSEDVAAEYEDSTITSVAWAKLAAAGMTLEGLYADNEYDLKAARDQLADDPTEEFRMSIGPDDFVRIWLFVAKLGDPTFEFVIEEDNKNSVNIGGYGLFQ